eukprot:gene32361-5052_t
MNAMKEHLVVSVEDGEPGPFCFSFQRLLKFMGPGLLMSIAFVDPGNLESDLQTGVTSGYDLLWVLLLTTMLGFVVQMQSAKLGVVTGKHLAEHCREQYKPVPRYALWIMAEVAIIGSDIQEVVGSAIAILLLSGGRIPLWGGVLITALDSFALLYIEKIGVRLLEMFFGVLIAVMIGAFGVMFCKADVPLDAVMRGFFIPTLPQKDIPTAALCFIKSIGVGSVAAGFWPRPPRKHPPHHPAPDPQPGRKANVLLDNELLMGAVIGVVILYILFVGYLVMCKTKAVQEIEDLTAPLLGEDHGETHSDRHSEEQPVKSQKVSPLVASEDTAPLITPFRLSGLLVTTDEELLTRARQIWEKSKNHSKLARIEADRLLDEARTGSVIPRLLCAKQLADDLKKNLLATNKR